MARTEIALALGLFCALPDFCSADADQQLAAASTSPSLAARVAESAWQDLAQRLVNPESDDLTAAKGDTVSIDWQDCGGAHAFGHITKLEPSKFTLGHKVPISLTAKYTKPIEDGATYHIKAKYRFITLIDQTHPFCHHHDVTVLGGKVKVPIKFPWRCPVTPPETGSVSFHTHAIQLPDRIPSQFLHSSVDIRVKTKAGEDAFCLKLKVSKASLVAQETLEAQNVTIV